MKSCFFLYYGNRIRRECELRSGGGLLKNNFKEGTLSGCHAIYFWSDGFVKLLSLIPILILLLYFLDSIDLEIHWFMAELEDRSKQLISNFIIVSLIH